MTNSNAEGGAAAPRGVRVSLPTDFTPKELVAFIFRPDVVNVWLGPQAVLVAEVGAPVRLPRPNLGPTHEPEQGNVARSSWSGEIFELVVVFPSPDQRGVRLSVTPRPVGRSYLRIVEGGANSADDRSAALRLWQKALNRLAKLLTAPARTRRRTRQALILVHGIGEQRPGQTLRRFVAAVFPESPDQHRYFKPDYVSPLFELRTVMVPGEWATRRPTTDVYELYWAHLIRDTTLAQVYGWVGRLAMAPNRMISPTLVKHVWVIRIVVLVATLAFIFLSVIGQWAAWTSALALGTLAFLPAALWAIWRAAQNRFLLGFLGDAARYLEPLPDNILRRQEIRAAGVDLLDALHNSGRYSRIIVYGQSLGSVIAYDILSHAWTRRSRTHKSDNAMSSRRMLAVEDLLNPRDAYAPPPTTNEIQRRQHDAWREYRRNGFEWRVSDFVTAGSPLTHARWLLNLDRQTSFDDLVADRSFPTCPPQTEPTNTPSPGRTRRTFTFTHSYPDPSGGGSRSVLVPHFAGLFAVTRWTNLYFPFEGVIKGDPVGGPLQGTFGGWIHDVPLTHPGGGVGGFAHTFYSEQRGKGTHIACLRQALRLPSDLDLLDLSPVQLMPDSTTRLSGWDHADE